MKPSIRPLLVLLATLVAAPLFADEAEGEGKRYRVILEKKKSVADIKDEVKVEEAAEVVVRHGGERATAGPAATEEAAEIDPQEGKEQSRKWWKPWGGSDPKVTSKSKSPAKEKGNPWWMPWSEESETAKTTEEAVVTAPKETEAKKSPWWKPWGKEESKAKEAEASVEAPEATQEKKGSWWKPWSKSESGKELREKQLETAEEESEKDGKKWWKPWGKDEAPPKETKPGKWWKPWD